MERSFFYCIWCKKSVKGFLLIKVIDYVKKTIYKEFSCPNCPSRVTRETKKL